MKCDALWSPNRVKWTELASADLKVAAWSTRVVNGDIWSCAAYCDYAKFNKRLQQKRTTTKTNAIRWTLDIAETNNGDIVVASTSGLFHMQRYGERSKNKFLFNSVINN